MVETEFSAKPIDLLTEFAIPVETSTRPFVFREICLVEKIPNEVVRQNLRLPFAFFHSKFIVWDSPLDGTRVSVGVSQRVSCI